MMGITSFSISNQILDNLGNSSKGSNATPVNLLPDPKKLEGSCPLERKACIFSCPVGLRWRKSAERRVCPLCLEALLPSDSVSGRLWRMGWPY